MMKRQVSIILFILISIALEAQVIPATLDKPKPVSKAVGVGSGIQAPVAKRNKPVTLASIDSIANDGIQNKVYPGCHVLVLKEGKPLYDKCFGYLTYKKT